MACDPFTLRLLALKSLKSVFVLGIGVQLGFHNSIYSIDFLCSGHNNNVKIRLFKPHPAFLTWFKVPIVSCSDLSVRYFIVFHWKPRIYWSIDSTQKDKHRVSLSISWGRVILTFIHQEHLVAGAVGPRSKVANDISHLVDGLFKHSIVFHQVVW
jgi:hypothetical protein